jgi:hypothetical protein
MAGNTDLVKELMELIDDCWDLLFKVRRVHGDHFFAPSQRWACRQGIFMHNLTRFGGGLSNKALADTEGGKLEMEVEKVEKWTIWVWSDWFELHNVSNLTRAGTTVAVEGPSFPRPTGMLMFGSCVTMATSSRTASSS